MKTWKNLFYLMAVCLCTLGFQACNDDDGPDPDKNYDFYPIEIYLTLTGENGEDLLDPSVLGTYAGLATKATYRDKTYQKDAFEEGFRPHGRAYAATMYGIYTDQLQDGRYALVFGQLDSTKEYKDEELIIEWGDGTKDVITFSSRLKWKKHEPVFNRSFKLNGYEMAKDTPFPVIDIRKEGLVTMELDVTPLVFNIYLLDNQGKDLLNTMVDGHVDADSVKAIFQGKEYYLNDDPNSKAGRAILPEFTGLTLPWHDQNDTSPHPLYFGELDGAKSFEDEMLIMDWGKLGRDTITFTSKMEWEYNKPYFTRNYWLNGEEVAKDTSRPAIWIRK